MFPLIAKDGGVLKDVDKQKRQSISQEWLVFEPSGVICEIMNEDGTMARLDDLRVYAKKHDLKLISIADMVEYINEQS